MADMNTHPARPKVPFCRRMLTSRSNFATNMTPKGFVKEPAAWFRRSSRKARVIPYLTSPGSSLACCSVKGSRKGSYGASSVQVSSSIEWLCPLTTSCLGSGFQLFGAKFDLEAASEHVWRESVTLVPTTFTIEPTLMVLTASTYVVASS